MCAVVQALHRFSCLERPAPFKARGAKPRRATGGTARFRAPYRLSRCNPTSNLNPAQFADLLGCVQTPIPPHGPNHEVVSQRQSCFGIGCGCSATERGRRKKAGVHAQGHLEVAYKARHPCGWKANRCSARTYTARIFDCSNLVTQATRPCDLCQATVRLGGHTRPVDRNGHTKRLSTLTNPAHPGNNMQLGGLVCSVVAGQMCGL